MNVHQDIQEIIKRQVLPEVIRVHGLDVPYQAELWIREQRRHEDGTVMFNIDDEGHLIAEYFAYDNIGFSLVALGPHLSHPSTKLVIKSTQVEVPVSYIQNSEKARVMYGHYMPDVKAYKCTIQGWVGDPDSQMRTAHITLVGLSNIPLGHYTTPLPEECVASGDVILQGFTQKAHALRLEFGEWEIRIAAAYSNQFECEPLYHATLLRKDGSPFTLRDDIVDALWHFMSFQCEAWVTIPTIVCNPAYSVVEKTLDMRDGKGDPDIINAVNDITGSGDQSLVLDKLGNALCGLPGFEDVADMSLSYFDGLTRPGYAQLTFTTGERLVKRASVGQLKPQDSLSKNVPTTTDFRGWPKLFAGFWEQYSDEESRRHLKNVIGYYVNRSRILTGGMVYPGVDTTQAMLEAVVRWWNNKNDKFSFEPNPRSANSFVSLLKKTICSAELGKDAGKRVDLDEVNSVVRTMKPHRNKIAHGTLSGDIGTLLEYQTYYQNLTRLLILSKLGDRGTNARGMGGPTFVDISP